MRTFDAEYPEGRTLSAARLCLGLLLSALLGVWLGQQSINAYWLAHYHRDSPLLALERFPLWRAGGTAHRAVGDFCVERLPGLNPSAGAVALAGAPNELEQGGAAAKTPAPEAAKPKIAETAAPAAKTVAAAPETPRAPSAARQSPTTAKQTARTPKPAARPSAPQQTAAASRAKPTPQPALVPVWARPQARTPAGPDVTLRADDEVFFAGDSLMEGVAPHVSHWLRTNGVKSENRSRRSTGLSYPNPKVRDWPLEIETVLAGNPNIKLVVVFLGPNDPGGFPDPEAPRRRFLRFQSEAWENVYRDRIGRILTAAEKHGARVIWLGLPYMRKAEFNRQMAYLDEVMRSETAESALALFLPTKDLLSVTGAYSDSIPVNGREVTVRAKDGIHFTPSGQRILARAIQERIEIVPKPGGEGGGTALP